MTTSERDVLTCRETWELMTARAAGVAVRNFTQLIDMSDFLVETPMFPKDVLEAYSAWNLELEITEVQRQYFDENRGGAQGDYREGMQAKIANVIDALRKFPRTKRAVITISNNPQPSHSDDSDAKCLREIHFYLEPDNRLNATVLFRAQAAQIFPKNIHFIGSVMKHVADGLDGDVKLGKLFYLATILVSQRSD